MFEDFQIPNSNGLVPHSTLKQRVEQHNPWKLFLPLDPASFLSYTLIQKKQVLISPASRFHQLNAGLGGDQIFERPKLKWRVSWFMGTLTSLVKFGRIGILVREKRRHIGVPGAISE
jgi:hypothetical protein